MSISKGAPKVVKYVTSLMNCSTARDTATLHLVNILSSTAIVPGVEC